MIVTVATVRASVTFTGVRNVTVKVSFGSLVKSVTIGIAIVCEVDPGAMVTVPVVVV